jgi:hypothetical protein
MDANQVENGCCTENRLCGAFDKMDVLRKRQTPVANPIDARTDLYELVIMERTPVVA